MIRSPIICVLGHVDHGKTAILDSIRGSTVLEGEPGKITQHVGASFIPTETIKEQSKEIIDKYGYDLEIPGLLFIDTPGHQAFTSLRKRGGKTADLAVLVIDIMQGIQPQTKEAIEILKKHKCPFIIALNKIDMIQGWRPNKGESFTKTIKKQSERVRKRLEEKTYDTIGEIAKHGINTNRFDKVENPEKTIIIIPTSAETKEGIPELLMFLAGLSQRYMKKQLNAQEETTGEGTILEVKKVKGLGTTIDTIIFKGKIKKGDKIVIGTKEGAKETKIRALLKPKELKEMREAKGKDFKRVKEVTAAEGIKIAAPGLEEAIAGSPVIVANEDTEEKKKEVAKEIKEATIENQSEGVIVKADTIGSLEGIVDLFKDKEIPIRRAEIGKVRRRDVTEAKTIKEKNRYLGGIFAFNTKVLEEAEKKADEFKVPIFKSDIIYKLEEEYEEWKKEEEQREKEEKLEKYTYPAKLKILPEHTFRKSKPAIVGVKLLQGKLKPGYRLMNKNGKETGEIKSIQKDQKSVKLLEQGEEAAISIKNVTVGRQIEEGETLYTDVPVDETYELERKGFKNKQLIREIRSIKR